MDYKKLYSFIEGKDAFYVCGFGDIQPEMGIKALERIAESQDGCAMITHFLREEAKSGSKEAAGLLREMTKTMNTFIYRYGKFPCPHINTCLASTMVCEYGLNQDEKCQELTAKSFAAMMV